MVQREERIDLTAAAGHTGFYSPLRPIPAARSTPSQRSRALLASEGVNVRSTTAPEANGTERPARSTGKLIAWCAFVGALIAVNYTLNYATHQSKSTTETAFYHYSTAIGSAFLYLVWFGLMLAIVGGRGSSSHSGGPARSGKRSGSRSRSSWWR